MLSSGGLTKMLTKSEEAKALQDEARRAAAWCSRKLEARVSGSGQSYLYSEAERTALHVAHSIAVSEVARLQPAVAD
jgi:hypothetical protein